MAEFTNQVYTIFCNGAVVTAFFVVLLLYQKNVRRSRANLFLSILLVALAFSIIHILYAGNVFRHFSNGIYSPGDPTFLLIAPLAWFYALELTGQRVKFNRKLLLHFTPFFLVILFSLSIGSGYRPGEINLTDDYKRFFNIFFRIVVVVQFSCYQYFIHKKWLTHQKILQQEVSNTENVNISWVKFFLIVFLIINLFFFISLVTAIHWENLEWLQKATAAVFSASILALSLKGILQRDVFDTLIITEKPREPDVPAVQGEPNSLSKANQLFIDKLISHMTEKKPYLDPELSLTALAKDVNMSRSQLSQLINDGIGENFYDFVNKYRVEEVKQLLSDPDMANFSLLGIAFEAGFKSKSTFNLIFKRFTGLTPTEYRKNIAG